MSNFWTTVWSAFSHAMQRAAMSTYAHLILRLSPSLIASQHLGVLS